MNFFRLPSRVSCLRMAAVAALAGTGLAAQAQTAGDSPWTFYLGGAYIDVHAKSKPLHSEPETLPEGYEAGIRVGDKATVGFGASYRFNPNWSAELVLGLPPEHSVYGTGAIESFGQIALVKQAPPTVFVNYHIPLAQDFSAVVGLGLNYTKFLRVRSTPAGDAASGGDTDTKLKSSIGLAGHVGGIFQIDKNWSLVGTIAYADVRSKMTATTETNLGDGPVEVVRTTKINFRPIVYSLSVGYTF